MQNLQGRSTRLALFSLMLVFALVLGACGNEGADTGGDQTVGEEIVDGDAEIIEDDAAADETDADAAVDAEAEADVDADVDTDEADVVATEVVTETLTDTDVMTETIVTTETETAEVLVETTVMTDTDVTVDTETDTETDTQVETEDVSESDALAIIVLADTSGNQFLGDPLEQRPFFASDQESMLMDERFAPIEVNDEALYDENLDSNLFGETEQDGMRQLTYNGYVLYRFTGGEDEDWMTAAQEAGLLPLTPEGEFGEISE